MNRLTPGDMQRIKGDLKRMVPGYYLPQTDVFEALETEVGNCFAKAMIASGIVVLRHNIVPSVAYSERIHGTLLDGRASMIERPINRRKPRDPRSKKMMAHIAMVAPGFTGTGEIDSVTGIHFGTRVFQGEKFSKEDEIKIIDDYNRDTGDYLTVDPSGEIAPTDLARAEGMTAGNWKEEGQKYLSKIDRPALDFEALLQRLADLGIRDYDAA